MKQKPEKIVLFQSFLIFFIFWVQKFGPKSDFKRKLIVKFDQKK
jgi:hypothetical protein